MRKKRGYKRETPVELVRDYKLFAIACEGGKREPEYFRIFKYLSNKIKVDIIEEKVSDEELLPKVGTRSAPKWVLQRAISYIEQEGLIDEDQLWFVMDVDRWDLEQLREIADYCKDRPNWHFVLSNPCFEVWLYFHKKSEINLSKSNTCNDFKSEISTFEKGGYHPLKFISLLSGAITNAKEADSDLNHFLPKPKETKVYQLGEAIMQVIGNKGYDDFINEILPNLIHQEFGKAKKTSGKRN
jgi:hypothetical protein